MHGLAVGLFEVMDKEPALWQIVILFAGFGILGLFLCKRLPLTWLAVVPLIIFYSPIREFTDASVGPAILHEAGWSYVVVSSLAVGLGVLLPTVGVYLNRISKKRHGAAISR